MKETIVALLLLLISSNVHAELFYIGDSQAAGQIRSTTSSEKQFVYTKNGITKVGASPLDIYNELKLNINNPNLKGKTIVLSPGADNADNHIKVHAKYYKEMANLLNENNMKYIIIPPGGKNKKQHTQVLKEVFKPESVLDTTNVKRTDGVHYNTQELKKLIGP